jgi:Amt family ammonium transporter
MTPGLELSMAVWLGKKISLAQCYKGFMAMIIVTVLWVIIAFGLSFGPTIGGVIGNQFLFFSRCGTNTA